MVFRLYSDSLRSTASLPCTPVALLGCGNAPAGARQDLGRRSTRCRPMDAAADSGSPPRWWLTAVKDSTATIPPGWIRLLDSRQDSQPARPTRPDATKPKKRSLPTYRARFARWPVPGPPELPGAILPSHRIVAFYGNPLSKRMGILGEIDPDEMLQRLDSTAWEWARVDPDEKVFPALHLIVTVAQGYPGPARKYRLQMPDSIVEKVAGWAEQRGWLLFLDVQAGTEHDRQGARPPGQVSETALRPSGARSRVRHEGRQGAGHRLDGTDGCAPR